MNSSLSSQGAPAGAFIRAIFALVGAALVLTSAAGLLMLARLFILDADLRPTWLGQQDLIIAALLAIVAFSLLMLGINLLTAAWRSRRHNIIPGPTLYLFGVTLVILGMFQLAAGAMLSALALATVGAFAMWLEVQFEFI